jgi:hypothetical protein
MKRISLRYQALLFISEGEPLHSVKEVELDNFDQCLPVVSAR